MAPSRARIIVMAAILGLVASAGTIWLVSTATGGDGKPAGQSTTIDQSAGGGSSGGVSPGQPNGPGAQAPGAGGGSQAGGAPKKGRQGIHVNGVRLDGNAMDDGCLTLINKTSTVGVIESVSFTVTNGPGHATARADVAHCTDTGDPPCIGITLQPGDQCVAGAVLTGRPTSGDYTLRANARYRYTCVNMEDSPCDQVGNWQGSPPTAEKPVQISGTTSNNVPRVGIYVEGSSPAERTSQQPSPDESPENTPDSIPDSSDAIPDSSDAIPDSSDAIPDSSDESSEAG